MSTEFAFVRSSSAVSRADSSRHIWSRLASSAVSRSTSAASRPASVPPSTAAPAPTPAPAPPAPTAGSLADTSSTDACSAPTREAAPASRRRRAGRDFVASDDSAELRRPVGRPSFTCPGATVVPFTKVPSTVHRWRVSRNATYRMRYLLPSYCVPWCAISMPNAYRRVRPMPNAQFCDVPSTVCYLRRSRAAPALVPEPRPARR